MTITKQEFDAALDKLGKLYEDGKDCLNSMMIHHPQDIDARTRVHEIIREMRDMMATQLKARLRNEDAKKDMEELHNESMYVMVASDMQEIRSVTIVTSAGVKVYKAGEMGIVRINVASLYFQGDPYDHYCGLNLDGEMVFSINCLVPCVVEYFIKDK